MVITRPRFESVPLSIGMQWRGGGGWRYEEKLDGIWHVRTLATPAGPATLVGELLPSASFHAFDIVGYAGRDLRPQPLWERLALLTELQHTHLRDAFSRPATGHGAEFLDAVISRGGEGVVAKRLSAPFGLDWFKCKRVNSFDLLVTAKATNGRASISLAELLPTGAPGEARGDCPCRADFDRIQVGDVVEILAYGLTARGKLREPRFHRTRPDKLIR